MEVSRPDQRCTILVPGSGDRPGSPRDQRRPRPGHVRRQQCFDAVGYTLSGLAELLDRPVGGVALGDVVV